MFEAIQRAYYQEARNPSDIVVLIALAGEIGLDTQRVCMRPILTRNRTADAGWI